MPGELPHDVAKPQASGVDHRPPMLLAVASGGGHWVQLLRLRPAFVGWNVSYVSTFADQASEMEGADIYFVPDTSRFRKSKLIQVAWLAFMIVFKTRPMAVITTGSAPGLFFLIAGRMLGAKTLWVDSIANSTRLSGTGRAARLVAHRTISQWPDVAISENVQCWGSVL